MKPYITLVKNRQPAGAPTRYDEWLYETDDRIILRVKFYVKDKLTTKEYKELSLKHRAKLDCLIAALNEPTPLA